MNKEDIIRMALEADFKVLQGGVPPYKLYVMNVDHLTRFAALVAAAEREECAKVCDELNKDCNSLLVESCAATIRSGMKA